LTRFFAEGAYVGELRAYFAAASQGGQSFSGHWPHQAFFCPECGDLWGRAVNDTSGFAYHPIPPAKWIVHVRPCAQHGDGILLPPEADLGFVSPDLLLREAHVYLFRDIT
jgi:hypothetical protein